MADRVRRKIRILFAASEAVPFAKTGGLGDVAGSLPRALKRAGAKVAVILPKYGTIPESFRGAMKHVADFYVPLAWRNVYCGIERLTFQGLDFYFIDNEDYFKRDSLYGYFDDGERFAFFSKAICEAIEKVPELECDVLHCNDWQTALAPVFLREFYQKSPVCSRVKTIFTVHNVKFQGQYSDKMLADVLGLDGIPAAASQLRCDISSINYMKAALLYADTISTVSPTYARELQMPFYGEGLDDIFRERSWCLHGILNGIDTIKWNPVSDTNIPVNFSKKDLAGKAEDKAALQKELGLRVDASCPLVVIVGRLTNQKGLGLVRFAMDRIMSRGIQIAILGTGDADQEDAFRYFDKKYGDMMCTRIAFDDGLAHRMYAAGDMLLMPSEFEPCGLAQMIAMRYGTLPVVRETGGLADSVEPYNQFTGEGTGFSFINMNADEMSDCLFRACEVFWTKKEVWEKLRHQAMNADFSWHRAANEYMDMYHDLHPEIIRYNKRR
ncbi:MAG: glycogen synthase GlgA [Olegusella sp.]|jgi:starch synthase|nr:glycogen synthase GlgA [Olegusella sp.]MCI1933559.1 glycogen synthase GlgA [Atopobiaceae bacterium]